MNATEVLTRILKYTAYLAALLAVVGGGVGFAVAGGNGLVSALVGTALAIFFSGVTALSMVAAAKIDLIFFFVVVMGAWIIKFGVFIGLLLLLRDQPFIQPFVLYATLMVAIVGTLVIDSIVVYRARIPLAATQPPARDRAGDL